MSQEYFAALSLDKIVPALHEVDEDWSKAAERRGLFRLWKLIYCQSQGIKPQTGQDEHGLTFVGKDQEFVRFRMNLARSHIKQRNQMAQGERVAWRAIATNNDSSSLASTKVAAKLLDYLARACRVDFYGQQGLESDGFFGEGFLWVRWDYEGGDDVVGELPATDEAGQPIIWPDTGEPVLTKQTTKSGFPVVGKLFPWQVAKEQYCSEPSWYIVKEPISKYELAARFPEKSREILAVDNLNKALSATPMLGWDTVVSTRDTVVLCHFYHRATKAIPNGRYIGYLGDIPLWDESCPTEKGLPVVSICTARYFGTEFGYSEASDLLAVQEMIDEMLSQSATNLARFGNQTLFVQEGVDVDPDNISKGGGIQYLKDGDKPPVAAQFAQMPEMAKWLLEYLPERMNEMTGLNSVVRGDPKSNITSGAFAALMTSIAEKYQGASQASYDQAIERLANIMLEFVRTKAAYGFVVEVAGSDHQAYVDEITQEDLKGIRRVWAERSNPLMNSIMGRFEVLQATVQLPKDTRKEAVEMLLTGNLDAYCGNDHTQSILIAKENERLMRGEKVTAMATDNVKFHCPSHQASLDRLRMQDNPDQAAIQAHLDHLAEHGMIFATQTDPIMADILGNPPPPQIPPQGPPVLGQGGNQPQPAGSPKQLPPGQPGPKQLKAVNNQPGAEGPRMPEPAQPPAN